MSQTFARKMKVRTERTDARTLLRRAQQIYDEKVLNGEISVSQSKTKKINEIRKELEQAEEANQ